MLGLDFRFLIYTLLTKKIESHSSSLSYNLLLLFTSQSLVPTALMFVSTSAPISTLLITQINFKGHSFSL